MKTKKLALGAILTAISIVFLYAGCVLPTGRIAMVAIASLLPAVAVLHSGLPLGFLVYAASAAIALLILPSKACAVAYALVLGWYGPVKSIIERIGRLAVEWIIKISLFCIVIAVYYNAFQALLLSMIRLDALPYSWLIVPLLVVVYILYDIAFTGMIAIYQQRIAKHIKL